ALQQAPTRPGRAHWHIAILGLLAGVGYILLPDSFGTYGGYLKTRLVVIPPLLWLACFRIPEWRMMRQVLWGSGLAAAGINLVLVISYFSTANDQLNAFVAGKDLVGHDRTLAAYVTKPKGALLDPLDQAYA